MDILLAQEILDSKIFTFSYGQHNHQSVIWIHFPYSVENIIDLKRAVKAKWSQSNKCWYALDNHHNREKFNLPIKLVGKEILSKIHPINQPAFDQLINILKLKAYSNNTMRTYAIEFAQFLHLLQHHDVEGLEPEKIQSYFLYCVNELQLSESVLNSRINAIKFYYEKVLHRQKMFIDIPRPKKPLRLPKALNQNEIIKIIDATENIKHRLIIKLCYGMGLRVSEIVKIKIEDIDSVAMTVFIYRAKGKKDRYVNLPETILQELREYYKLYRPKVYLFEGIQGGQYSIRSAQSVFKQAMLKAGIHKNIGIHSLRHSYATHLLQHGTDISHIQKLLGHNNIKTTLNYTKVTSKDLSKVKSPIDYLRPS